MIALQQEKLMQKRLKQREEERNAKGDLEFFITFAEGSKEGLLAMNKRMAKQAKED